MTNYAAVSHTRTVTDWAAPGEEPVGAAAQNRLYAIGGLAAWGCFDLGPPAFGPQGDPTRSFAGDLGPRQGAFKGRLLSAGARGTEALRGTVQGDDHGLPSSHIPSIDLVNAPGWTAAAQFGVRAPTS